MQPRSSTWNLQAVANTDVPGCDLVQQWLREHNWAANPTFMTLWHQPEHAAQPLVLLATVSDKTVGDEVIGGLFAETQFKWLKISLMSVSPQHRSQGIGAALLAEAERVARTRGCQYAHVDTMSYQAPQFYLRHGYKVAGELADWDSHGHSKFHFTKHL